MRDPLMLATGKALALVVAVLHRDGLLDGEDFAQLLALFGAVGAEAEQRDILTAWATMIEDLNGPDPEKGS